MQVGHVDMHKARLASDRCSLDDLCSVWNRMAVRREALALDDGWARRWRTHWSLPGSQVVYPVRDLESAPTAGCQPVRRFSWQTGQRHRPGLQYLVSTGRHHGFESLAEQRLLLAVDFTGETVDVLGQPFRLRFGTVTGWREHVPDFLVATRHGRMLIDVRPDGRIGTDDEVCFAATREAALVAGWRYLVVTGWRPHVQTSLDTLSAQRRPLRDPIGLQQELLSAAATGPRPFGDLVTATRVPAVARAHALHLIWHRRLGVDLAAPLGDTSMVWTTACGSDR